MDHVLLFTEPGGPMIPVDKWGPIIGRLFDFFRARTVPGTNCDEDGPSPTRPVPRTPVSRASDNEFRET